MDDMFVTPNHAGGAVGPNEKGPPKKNPVSHWRVSKKSIIGTWSRWMPKVLQRRD